MNAGYLGLHLTRFKLMEKFSNTLADFAIVGNGLAILLPGI